MGNKGFVWVKLLIVLQCFSISISAYSMPLKSAPQPSSDSAVILMYHNISEEAAPSTSVTPATFKKHMQYLADNDFTIWPLSRILEHVVNGQPYPPKTVALTFDDAYSSVYSQAFPILKEKSWPFTVFVTTQYIDDNYGNFMNWQQLQDMQLYGGEIGNHSHSHAHLIRHQQTETEEQWQLRITNEIKLAESILKQKIGSPIKAFAYPYGEYSKAIKNILKQRGYFGIGQQSGAVSQHSDLQAIPRFPMATGFDELSAFAMKVRVKDLPVTILSPEDGIVTNNDIIPVLKLRLEEGEYQQASFSCYASLQGAIHLDWQDNNRVVTVRANEMIKSGRSKYNCTAASKTEKDVYYWFSFLWMKTEINGSWYRE